MAIAAGSMLCAGGAHAEYVENQMGREMAAIALGTAGSVALGFDVANIVLLAEGPGGGPGRIVTGVGSLVAGNVLIAFSAIPLVYVGEDHIPGGPQNTESEEAVALRQARAIAGTGIALGSASLALGVAALATFQPQDVAASRWRFVPVALGDGVGIGCAATF